MRLSAAAGRGKGGKGQVGDMRNMREMVKPDVMMRGHENESTQRIW